MTLLLGPADADHYRTKVGRYNDRWYTDPLPADTIAEATDGTWPSVSSVKKASSTDWTFVGLKRVAAAVAADPTTLHGLDEPAAYDRLKSINRLALAKAGDRGTQVHAYFERALRGLSMESSFDHPDGARYLPAIRAFLDHYQPEMVASELVCINRTLNGYGYGGTADALIRIDGKTYLPDWKSRGDTSDHGAYPEEAAQLGGYAAADYIIAEGPQRQPMPHLDGGLIVSVRPDGYRIYPIDLDRATAHWTSLHAWWVARRDERESVRKPWAPRSSTPADTPTPVATALGELSQAIAEAQSVGVLTALWQANQRHWDDSLTELARAQRVLIESGTV